MPRRICRALDLIDDAALIAAYERRHAPGAVWPEIIDDIRAQGVIDLEIWRTGPRLVMIAEVHDDFPRARPHEPRVDEWETLMWHFQKALPHAAPGEKWVPMSRIFVLGPDAPD